MDIKWIGAHSNNFEKGRRSVKIDTIVLHWMVGSLASAGATFNNANRGASAHYGIGGQAEVHQYVKDEDTAYHAGNFSVNLRSIGIEHEGGPNIPISESTYKLSVELVSTLSKKYNIPLDRAHVRKHGEISATQCPGTLDIDRIIREAKALQAPTEDPKDKRIRELEAEKNQLWKEKTEWEAKAGVFEMQLAQERNKYNGLRTRISEFMRVCKDEFGITLVG